MLEARIRFVPFGGIVCYYPWSVTRPSPHPFFLQISKIRRVSFLLSTLTIGSVFLRHGRSSNECWTKMNSAMPSSLFLPISRIYPMRWMLPRSPINLVSMASDSELGIFRWVYIIPIPQPFSKLFLIGCMCYIWRRSLWGSGVVECKHQAPSIMAVLNSTVTSRSFYDTENVFTGFAVYFCLFSSQRLPLLFTSLSLSRKPTSM